VVVDLMVVYIYRYTIERQNISIILFNNLNKTTIIKPKLKTSLKMK